MTIADPDDADAVRFAVGLSAQADIGHAAGSFYAEHPELDRPPSEAPIPKGFIEVGRVGTYLHLIMDPEGRSGRLWAWPWMPPDVFTGWTIEEWNAEYPVLAVSTGPGGDSAGHTNRGTALERPDSPRRAWKGLRPRIDEDDAVGSTWVATFASGVEVTCDEGGWSMTIDDPEVSAALEMGTDVSWPSIAGWPMPTTPGFDPDWMYLRLFAIGAIDVQGPCPPCDAEDEAEHLPDDIVG